MKPIQFTIEETELIRSLLKERIEQYRESERRDLSEGRKSIYTSELNSLTAASAKVGTHAAMAYTDKDKSMIISCCNPACENLYKKMSLRESSQWLDVSEQQRDLIAQCEILESILSKCNFYREKGHPLQQERPRCYGQTLYITDNLKRSDKIFISKTGSNDYYKIAFVVQDEKYVEIELKNSVYVRRMELAPLLEGTHNKFGAVTNRAGAIQMLATCEEKSYPDGTLDFVRAVLSYSN